MYDRIQTINKLYSRGLYQSYQSDYRDAIVNTIITYGSHIPARQTISMIYTSPVEKLKYIDEKLKIMSEIVIHKLRESLLSLQPKIRDQYVTQQFNKIIKVLDDTDASNLERLTDNIKKSVSLNINNKDSQKLYKLIDASYKVAVPAKLTKQIADVKDEISNLDKYFIQINNYIGVIKQSKDQNAIKALSGLIKSIEKYIKDKNSIQQFNIVTSILSQQNISPEDADKLSKTITYLEQNIKNQNSIALDDIIALLNKHAYENQIQSDFQDQNMMQKKSTISITGRINQVEDSSRKNTESTTQEYKKLTSVDSHTNNIAHQVQPTSSLDHRFGEDQKSIKQACINFQHTISLPSGQLMQNSSKLSQFTSRKAPGAAKPKNNTGILYTDL